LDRAVDGHVAMIVGNRTMIEAGHQGHAVMT
jgi:hypothetical protein